MVPDLSRQLIRDYHRYIGWKYEDMDAARGRDREQGPAAPADRAEEAALRESIIMGPPDQVAATIDEYRRAAGGDLVFIARLYFPGLPWDIQRQALRLFTEQVAPRARELAAGASD